jgi:ABC-type taurine transport system ATPase subunit
MNDLFSSEIPPPLAERMRPRSLDGFFGQSEVVGEGRILRRMLEKGALESSLIFWGPPGCGKTTLAHIIAEKVDADFVFFSAVTSGIADVRRIVYSTPGKDKRQTMFFGATLTPEVERLAGQWTRNPVHVEIEREHVAAESIGQLVYLVTTEEKFVVLLNLIIGQNLEKVLFNIRVVWILNG